MGGWMNGRGRKGGKKAQPSSGGKKFHKLNDNT